nr:hypothetical protein CFP56_65159 [Quercus suber]
MAPASSLQPSIPLIYSLFFLWIEPIATAVGAYYAFFLQPAYKHMTGDPFSAAAAHRSLIDVSRVESIVLYQLANLYLVFALNEALVLRATRDLRVWRVLLLGLLIADFGHLYSVHAQGSDVYWRAWDWNAMYWGNLGFVYVGASMRTAFLLGLGLSRPTAAAEKRKA